MSDESQNDKFAGDLISDMVDTVCRAEAKNGGIRNSQTANAGDVTYETVTKAFAETCRIASERTNGAYRCIRGPHADGPCAAVPALRYTGPEIEASPLGMVEQVPCDHPEPCGFKHWQKLTPHKPGDSIRTSDGTLYFSKDGETFLPLGMFKDLEYHVLPGTADRGFLTSKAPIFSGLDLAYRTRWERIKDWFSYRWDDIARYEPKWKKKPGRITTDSMGNAWLNSGGKTNIQFTGKITAGAEKLFGYPVILDDSVPFNKITFGPAPEQPRAPISTLTFCHRISIMFGAFKMLRINKQPFNWRSIPELGRYLFSGKLPGMDKPFKAETLKAFGVPAEKFAQGGVVAPSKTPYIVGE